MVALLDRLWNVAQSGLQELVDTGEASSIYFRTFGVLNTY